MRSINILFSALYRNMSSSSMTMYIGFPSKVSGVTIVGKYPLGFVGVGTGIDLDPFARVSTSEALSASSVSKPTIPTYLLSCSSYFA